MFEDNKFKELFKHFKRKQPPPSFDEVTDPYNNEHWKLFSEQSACHTFKGPEVERCHMNQVSQWKIGYLKATPGLVVVKNVFSSDDEFFWAEKCLKDYSTATFKRNIDHPSLKINVNDWWEESKKDISLKDKLRWSTLGYHHDWDSKVSFAGCSHLRIFDPPPHSQPTPP